MRMKKSAQVPAALVFAVSATLISFGCGADVVEVRRCVDQNGFVLPDTYCGPYGGGYGGYSNYGGYRIYGRPSYVYGGVGSNSFGGYVSGYSRVPTEGAQIRTTSGTTLGTWSQGQIRRNGFGSGGGGGGSFGS